MRSTNPRISSSWCALGSPKVSCWVLVPLDLGGEWHWTARVSAGVTTRGAGPGRGGPVSGRRRQGPGDQRPVDLHLAAARPHRPWPGAGLSSGERAELAKAKLRVAELETELRAMRQGPGPRLVRIGTEWFLAVSSGASLVQVARWDPADTRPGAEPPDREEVPVKSWQARHLPAGHGMRPSEHSWS